MLTTTLLAAVVATACASDLYWVGRQNSLAADNMWTGGVNPFSPTAQIALTTFGASGKAYAGTLPAGATARTGTVRFSGNFRLVLQGQVGNPGRINLSPNQMGVQASTQNLDTDDYRSAFDWNNPLNWATAPEGNIHPGVPPGTSDSVHFLASATPRFATTFGRTASAGSIVPASGSAITQCTSEAGAVGSPSGALLGATVVSVAPCSNFNMGTGAAGTAAFPVAYYDTDAPINGLMYRVVTAYDGPASTANNGQPWVYQKSGSNFIGPLTNFDTSVLPCVSGTGNCDPTTIAPASSDGSSSSDSFLGTGLSMVLFIIIVAAVVVVLIAGVLFLKSGKGDKSTEGRQLKSNMDTRGAQGVGFQNPLYEAGDQDAGADYMDINPESVHPSDIDNDPGGGYADVAYAEDPDEDDY